MLVFFWDLKKACLKSYSWMIIVSRSQLTAQLRTSLNIILLSKCFYCREISRRNCLFFWFSFSSLRVNTFHGPTTFNQSPVLRVVVCKLMGAACFPSTLSLLVLYTEAFWGGTMQRLFQSTKRLSCNLIRNPDNLDPGLDLSPPILSPSSVFILGADFSSIWLEKCSIISARRSFEYILLSLGDKYPLLCCVHELLIN